MPLWLRASAQTWACRGLVMPGATARLYAARPNSCIGEGEKYRHLKYAYTSVDKKNKFRKIKLNLFKMVFLFLMS